MRSCSDFHNQHKNVPLFVDLDGTLVHTDVAHELLVRGLCQPSCWKAIFPAIAHGGRASLKRKLAVSVGMKPELLPYNSAVLDYLAEARSAGRTIVLATAADSITAHQVADHVGLFDDIIASEPCHNMKGRAKLEAIRNYIASHEFEYLGDALADLPIWRAATFRGFVNPPKEAREFMQEASGSVSFVHNDPEMSIRSLVRAMRPHQWSKNILIFLPLIFSHSYSEPSNLLLSLLAFISFSLCASAVYLFNDLLDVEADRAHPSKRHRPFAKGNLSPVIGVSSGILLFVLALLLGFLAIGTVFGLVLLSYIFMTKCYSIWLKKYSTVDVVVLAMLYTVRIIAGAAAIMVPVSPWLLSFSLFFFLSLAYMKRFIELSNAASDRPLSARNYSSSDLTIVQIFGIANGAVSLLTLAEYINSPAVSERYKSPEVLWLIIPLMMLWLYRSWMWAGRGRIDDDPVVFALRDRSSQLTVLISAGIVLGARVMDVNWILL